MPALRWLGHDTDEEKLQDIINRQGISHERGIHFSEFTSIVKNVLENTEKRREVSLRQNVPAHARNNLTSCEIRQFMRIYGEDLSDTEINEMLHDQSFNRYQGDMDDDKYHRQSRSVPFNCWN